MRGRFLIVAVVAVVMIVAGAGALYQWLVPGLSSARTEQGPLETKVATWLLHQFTAVLQDSVVSRTAHEKRWALRMQSRQPPTQQRKCSKGGIRALVRRNKLAVAAELIAEPNEDALIAGATSIADIGKLMEELQTARDYLHYEGERLRQMTARLRPSRADRISLGQGHRRKLGQMAQRRDG